MITHRLEDSSVRATRPRHLPPGAALGVKEKRKPVSDPSLEDTVPRRTLAQESFAPQGEQLARTPSALRPEAAPLRRDLTLVARAKQNFAANASEPV